MQPGFFASGIGGAQQQRHALAHVRAGREVAGREHAARDAAQGATERVGGITIAAAGAQIEPGLDRVRLDAEQRRALLFGQLHGSGDQFGELGRHVLCQCQRAAQAARGTRQITFDERLPCGDHRDVWPLQVARCDQRAQQTRGRVVRRRVVQRGQRKPRGFVSRGTGLGEPACALVDTRMAHAEPHAELDLRRRAAGGRSLRECAFLLQPENVFEREALGNDARSQRQFLEVRMGQVVEAGCDMLGETVDAEQIAPPGLATGGGVPLAGEREKLNVLSTHVGAPGGVACAARAGGFVAIVIVRVA